MRTIRFILFATLAMVVLFSQAQEYDDLYFTRNDRKVVKPIDEVEEEVNETNNNSSFLSRQFQEHQQLTDSYSTNEVSEEAIRKYQRSNIATSDNEEEVENTNPNFSVPEERFEEPVVVNNYYGNNWGGPRNRWAFGWNNGWGWQPWRSHLWLSYGWGAFGNPWVDQFWGFNNWGWGSFYDPFWCPPGFNSWGWGGFYDPFWSPGFNNWGWGFNRGRYWGPAVVVRESNARAVTRGARSSRGGAVSSSGRSTALRSVSAANSINDSRDYSDAQAKYLNQSRRNARISNSSGTSSSATRRSSGNVNSRSSSRSNANRSFSNTSNRSSNSGYRSRSSSGSSRSSGYRSSGSSRSSRSSGSMRSSGSSRSSSGRSSGGSRSSSSRSRRGN